MEFCVCLCFCYAFLCVHFSFAIILKRQRKLVVLLLLSYRCIVTINLLLLFLTVPWIGLQCETVVFLDQIHLLFERMDIEVIPLSKFWNNVLDVESTLYGLNFKQPPYRPS